MSNKPTTQETFTALAEETGALFKASKSQRAIKARFWTIISGSITGKNPHKMTTMEIAQTVRDNRLMNWWAIPGFKDWFLNSTEHIERLEYLFSLALDAAEDVLLTDDPKAATAKVNMVKIIAELAKKMPSKEVNSFKDDKIAKMSKEEIEAYLAEQGVSIRNETVVPIEAAKEEETNEA